MENASKALIMAGGVLISLLVIGLLVMFFNNLSNLQNIKQSGEESEAIAEFNKQYDVYARNVYGSELLSISQKIEDYNKREYEIKGYQKIDLEVIFNTTPDKDIFSTTTIYNSVTLNEAIENINKKVKKYSSRDTKDGMVYSDSDRIKKRTISQLATMRTNDLKAFFGLDENKTNKVYEEVNEKIQEYNVVKNLLSEVKQHAFEFKGVVNDENTGRIIKMKYEY